MQSLKIPPRLDVQPSQADLAAARIAGWFLAFALLWIFASDKLLGLISADPATIVRYGTYKGSAFVIVTALLIFFLGRRSMGALIETQQREAGTLAALRLSTQHQKLAMEASLLGSWHLESGTGLVTCDARAQQHFGCGPKVSLEDLLARVHGEERKLALQAMAEMLDGHDVPPAEYRFRQHDGTERWVAVSTRLLSKADSHAGLDALGTSQDITERKTAEAALRENRSLLEMAASSAAIGLVVLDRNRCFTFANRTYLSLLGLQRDIVGLHVADVRAEIYRDQLAARLDAAYAGERVTFDLTQPKNDAIPDATARYFRVVYEPQTNARGEVANVIAAIFEITEIRRSTDALRASEKRFREIYEHALAAIMIVAWDGSIERCNPAMCQLLGYCETELRGRHFSTLIHPDDRPADVEKARRLRAGELDHFESEGRYLSKDGDPVWVRKIISTLPDDSDRPEKVFALAINVTESHQAEAALRQSEQRLQYVMAATGEGIWDWAVSTGAVTHNAQWCRILGLEDGYLEHRLATFTDLIHPEDRAKVAAAIKASLDGYGPYLSQHRMRRVDGSFVWVEDRGNVVERDDAGAALRMVGSLRDISERKKSEELQSRLLDELKQSENEAQRQKGLFKSVFECSPDSMVLADLDRQILAVNPAFTAVFGFDLAELHNVSTRKIYAAASDWDAVARFIAAGENGTMSAPLNCQRKSGERFPVQFAGARLLDASGCCFGYLGIYRDISVERTREQALLEKRRLEALGRLAGGVAHDFNNLLTVISGNIQLLELDISDEKHRRRLMAAERAAQMGARLNQRLMTFARQRRLEPVATNLNDLTRAMLDLLQRSVGESISIDCRLEAEPALALVDASEMENALLNLALNARDAMGSGGTLLLETSNCEFDGDGAAQVGGITPGRYTCLSVSDTGTGMSEEVLARAFDPFFTTKEPGKGTGLGLTSLHGFVRQSGGNVLLYSEVGHGTSVKIYLPSLDGGTEAPSISVPAPATTTGQGEAVLLVEDNAAVRAVTRDRLLQLGYRVVEAGDAAAALAVLDRDKSIDVVLSDIIMPGGMTGADLAKKIRLTRPQLPVILTSGFAGEMVQKHLSEVSPSAILRKPYGIDELARALQQALERR